MSNREILQQATSVFRDRFPSLNAEAVIAFIIIADHHEPTVGEISVAIGLSDRQTFQHMAPLRTAGLVGLQAQSNGDNKILLTGLGVEAKAAIAGIFSE